MVLSHTLLINTFDCQFLLVTGGYTGTTSRFIYLDSTEIFSDNVWRTVASKLPTGFGIWGLSVATINNRVLCYGNLLLIISKQPQRRGLGSCSAYKAYVKFCKGVCRVVGTQLTRHV